MTIGNEIVSGQTHDTNMHYIAGNLSQVGIDLMEARVVRDDPDQIIDYLRELKEKYHHVFTTGGIGPTHDDITTACVARALNLKLIMHEQAKRMLREFYGDKELTNARLKMAQVPAGARLIPNHISGAPGYSIANIHVLAGVPKIMAVMLQNLMPELTKGEKTLSKTIIALTGESKIAPQLEIIQNQVPEVAIGSYPRYHQQHGNHCHLVLRTKHPQQLDIVYHALQKMLQDQGIQTMHHD